MSQASAIRAKSQFHVLYKLVKAENGKLVVDRWRDYYGTPRTYMLACEEASKLEGEKGDRYVFMVRHAKVWKEMQNDKR